MRDEYLHRTPQKSCLTCGRPAKGDSDFCSKECILELLGPSMTPPEHDPMICGIFEETSCPECRARWEKNRPQMAAPIEQKVEKSRGKR